jgi:hypothetical protein
VSFVLDASVALLWLAPGTNPAGAAYASAVLKALKESQALAPSLWPLEVGNVIAKLEARNMVTTTQLIWNLPCARAIRWPRSMPVWPKQPPWLAFRFLAACKPNRVTRHGCAVDCKAAFAPSLEIARHQHALLQHDVQVAIRAIFDVFHRGERILRGVVQQILLRGGGLAASQRGRRTVDT